MTYTIDSRLISQIVEESKNQPSPLLEAIKEQAAEKKLTLTLYWPSLLTLLSYEDVFSHVKDLIEHPALFKETIALLEQPLDKATVAHLYDHLFSLVLSTCKDLPFIQPSFLYERTCEKLGTQELEFFKEPLEKFQMALVSDTKKTLHDLILYLAYDRLCVWMANIFEHPSVHENFLVNCVRLKELLSESFAHVFFQKKTWPCLFRYIEAIWAYMMRQEKLQGYSDAEWEFLSKAGKCLMPRHLLSSALGVDYQIRECARDDKESIVPLQVLYVFTSQDEEFFTKRYEFSLQMLEIIGKEYALNITMQKAVPIVI